MKVLRFMFIAMALLVLPMAALAGQRHTHTYLHNPDQRTSVTLTFGLGGVDNGEDRDLRTLGAALVYPAADDFSLLAGFSHSALDAARWGGTTDIDTDLFTVGVRFYLGH